MADLLDGLGGETVQAESPRRRSRKTASAPKPKKVKKPPKPLNPCFGATISKIEYPTLHTGVRLPFKPSTTALKRYAAALKHKPVMNWKEDPPRATFNDDAIRTLKQRYKDDPLYPILGKHREAVKCLGTYVHGLPVAADGRVHEVFKHTPETLRLAMQVLQTLPRSDDEEADSLYNRVRAMFIAAPGHVLLSRDYGGIEAVMVGYLAADPQFIRLCYLGIHDFVASHAIGKPADASWSDGELKEWFKRNKTDGGDAYDVVRTGCKRAVYLSLYGGGPAEMVRREPDIFKDKKHAQWYQDLILGVEDADGRRSGGLFPSINRWHWRTAETAERCGFLLAPSGFRLHFLDTISYTYSKRDGRWKRALGEPAKEAIAAVPQHLAACQMAQALALAWKDEVLRPFLRLSIHDELLLEVPEEMCDNINGTLAACMAPGLPFLPLPPEWNMGSILTVKTEAKAGPRWSELKKLA